MSASRMELWRCLDVGDSEARGFLCSPLVIGELRGIINGLVERPTFSISRF